MNVTVSPCATCTWRLPPTRPTSISAKRLKPVLAQAPTPPPLPPPPHQVTRLAQAMPPRTRALGSQCLQSRRCLLSVPSAPVPSPCLSKFAICCKHYYFLALSFTLLRWTFYYFGTGNTHMLDYAFLNAQVRISRNMAVRFRTHGMHR